MVYFYSQAEERYSDEVIGKKNIIYLCIYIIMSPFDFFLKFKHSLDVLQ